MLYERGVATEAMPSTWTEDEQRIVLEVLKEFLEDKAYADSGETVPERVLREVGDLIDGVRGQIMKKFNDPAADPTLKVSDILY